MGDGWLPRIRVFGRAMTLADYLRQAADAGDLEWAKALLAQGAPADGDDDATTATSASSSSSSPLFLAARGGHRDLVVLLTSHGADPARCGPEGTALMAACAANSAECVQALLLAAAESGAATTTTAESSSPRLALATARQPSTGETALHVAARSGAADAARALLDGVSSSSGATTDAASAAECRARLSWARDARGRTPAVAAGAAPCGSSSIEVMALLLASASAVTAAASAGGDHQHHPHKTSPAAAAGPASPPSSSLSPAASYASSSPPSPSPSPTTTPAAAAAPPGADTTALHLAAARGNGPLCSALLAACGSRAALRADARGALPLHLAARCARFEAAGILCRAMGAKGVKSARDAATGSTPLHEAAKSLLAPDAKRKAAMAKLLIDAGCDPTARDVEGKLASDYDSSVMPPVELEKVVVAVGKSAAVAGAPVPPLLLSASSSLSAGGAAVMAATAKLAHDLAIELGREDAERAAAAAAAAQAAEAAEEGDEAAGGAGANDEHEASARASAVLVTPSATAAAKAIVAKEHEAAVEREEGADGWTIERGGGGGVGAAPAAATLPQTD